MRKFESVDELTAMLSTNQVEFDDFVCGLVSNKYFPGPNKPTACIVTLEISRKNLAVVFTAFEEKQGKDLMVAIHAVLELTDEEFMDHLWQTDPEYRSTYLGLVKMTK